MLAESEEKGNLRRDMAGACPHSGLGETDVVIMTSTVCSLLDFFLPILCLLSLRVGDNKRVSNRQAWHELVWVNRALESLDAQHLRVCSVMRCDAMQCSETITHSLILTRRRPLNRSIDDTLPRLWERGVVPSSPRRAPPSPEKVP